MTGIIFNSVTAFVEQVGRRLVWKWAELDNMICIWVGPQASALEFKPQINSRHPQYPLMFVTDSSITYKEAGVAEVSVTYAGIIQTSGKTPYYTQPVVSTSPVQGSRDFSILYQQGVLQPGITYNYGPGGPSAPGGSIGVTMTYGGLVNVGTQQITIRWIGQQAEVRYMAYPEPSGFIYAGAGEGHCKWQIVSWKYGPVSIALSSATPEVAGQWVQQNLANLQPPTGLQILRVGFTKVQRGQWWECTEHYTPGFWDYAA